MHELFRAKLIPPRPVSDQVLRPRLLQLLNSAKTAPLTLVSAPAGFGKTTLLVEWLAATLPPSTWLSLDETDNDLSVFLSYFVAAIESIFPKSCKATKDLLRAPQLPTPAHLARQLGNDITELPSDFILVLDDYHVIVNPDVLALMGALFQPLPAPLHLVLATRMDPSLPLARLRARGQLVEVREADLRFSREEAGTFLNQSLAADLSGETLALIQSRTEGWAAGLRLAALALRGQSDPSHYEWAFREHGESFVMGYLLDEVFARQPAQVQTFLLQTSLLDKFTPELCDAIIGAPEPDTSRKLIEQFKRANLFLVTLDEVNGWYRYHHLFRDLLAQRREREFDAASQAAWHLNASEWFAAHGFIVEAIQHSLEAGDPIRAAEIVEANTHRALNKSDHATLQRWLALLPSDLYMVRPRLLMTRLYTFDLRLGLPAMEDILDTLEKLIATDVEYKDAAEQDLIHGDILATRCWLYYWQGRFPESVEMGTRALEFIPSAHIYVRSTTLFYLGLAYQASGETAAALRILTAVEGDAAAQSPLVNARALNALCTIYWTSADLPHVKRTAQALYEIGSAHNDAHIQSWAQRNLGLLNYEWNQLEAATQHLALVAQQRFALIVRTAHEALVGLALTYQARDLTSEANETSAQLVEFDREKQYPDALAEAYSLQARLALAQGDVETAWREMPRADELSLGPMLWFEQPGVTEILIRLAHGSSQDIELALEKVKTLLKRAEVVHDKRRQIQLLAIQALALDALGKTPLALETLKRSVQLAERGGFVRTYVDLGVKLAQLLEQVRECAPQYVQRILDAFPQSAPVSESRVKSAALIEPLTGREMQVLELLARRLSDKEIAAELVISMATAKTHVQHIFDKLGVNNRRAAVEKARALQILSPN